MKFIDKLERRFGRYAIHNLMLYMVIIFAIGLVIQMMSPMIYVQYLMLDPAAVLKGQVWRLVTFLLFPPSTSSAIFTSVSGHRLRGCGALSVSTSTSLSAYSR